MTSKLSDGVSDIAAHVLAGTADEGDDLLRDSVVPQQLPQHLSVHTVEGLLIVYEVDVEGEFHSGDCSTMIRRLAIWSTHDLFLQKPAC